MNFLKKEKVDSRLTLDDFKSFEATQESADQMGGHPDSFAALGSMLLDILTGDYGDCH